MTHKSRALVVSALFALCAGALFCFVTSGRDAKAAAPSIEEKPARISAAELTDEPLAAFRTELLDTAFQSASALPVSPHIKNRSRAQEEVVVACLELDQPRRALDYIEKIDNWRKGTGYADLAFYCVEKDRTRNVQPLLDLARHVADTTEDDTIQDASAQGWRKDRIRVKIARTHALLGDEKQAAELEAGAIDSEQGQVAIVEAKRVDPDDLDAELEALDAVVVSSNFEQLVNALDTYAELFNRFYSDTERRPRVEEKMKVCADKVPVNLHIELNCRLARYALDHNDSGAAIAFLNEAQGLLADGHWTLEQELPLAAKLAELRHRARDDVQARKDVDAALAKYDAHFEEIVDIYRAGALRPLAETYQVIGDSAAALTVYKRAIEAGVVNPNSRPRAEDLTATCCSMARVGLEPDSSLHARIQQVRAGLGDPW